MKNLVLLFIMLAPASLVSMNQKGIAIPGAKEKAERLAKFDSDPEFLSESLALFQSKLEQREERKSAELEIERMEKLASEHRSPGQPTDRPSVCAQLASEQELDLFGADDAARAGLLIHNSSISRNLGRGGLTQSGPLPRRKPKPVQDPVSFSYVQGSFMLEGWEDDPALPPEPESSSSLSNEDRLERCYDEGLGFDDDF